MRRQGLLSTTGLVLMVLIIGLTLHEWEDEVPLRDTGEPTGPALVVEGARARSFGEDGQLRYSLRAEHLERFEDEARTELRAPDVEMMQGAQHWRVNAEEGTVTGAANDLALRGQVHAERLQGSPLSLDTGELHYFPDQNRMTAPHGAVIRHPGGSTRAGHLEADIGSGILTLGEQVESRYEVPAS